jgi:hypothetical protein
VAGEGLAQYRARYESQAAALREQAGVDDAAALSRVTQLYFPTEASKLAALRLVELYIETGEFAAAAWTGERMLAYHPSLGDDRAKLLFRTALAEHLAGDAEAAHAKLDQLKSKHADAKGTFRGQDVALAAELEKVLASSAAVANGAATDSWPIFGGDATRGRVPVAAARPGTKLVDIPFVRPRTRPPQVGEAPAVPNPQAPPRRRRRSSAQAARQRLAARRDARGRPRRDLLPGQHTRLRQGHGERVHAAGVVDHVRRRRRRREVGALQRPIMRRSRPTCSSP